MDRRKGWKWCPLPSSQFLDEPFTGPPDQLASLGLLLSWAPPSHPGVSVPLVTEGQSRSTRTGPYQGDGGLGGGPTLAELTCCQGSLGEAGLSGSLLLRLSRGVGTLPCAACRRGPLPPKGSDLPLSGLQLPLPENGLWQGSNKVTEPEPCIGVSTLMNTGAEMGKAVCSAPCPVSSERGPGWETRGCSLHVPSVKGCAPCPVKAEGGLCSGLGWAGGSCSRLCPSHLPLSVLLS